VGGGVVLNKVNLRRLDQVRPTCGPKWIQDLKNYQHFHHFSISFCQIVGQKMGKNENCNPETNLGWTPLE
jgi:hypothetical protein